MADPITFTDTTAKLALPKLFPGQAQKEFFVNEAFEILDSVVHLTVEGTQDSPPSAPTAGESWIIGASATGEWAGHSGEVAFFGNGGWRTIQPSSGMLAYDKSLAQFRKFDGTWLDPVGAMEPQGGTTVDIEARSAITEIIAALRNFGVISSL